MSVNLTATSPLTVLIADDCPAVREAIRLTVQDLAGNIVEAADGEEAIDAYLTHKPAWVTLDLAMEPVDGFTAIRRIKCHDPAAKIIVVTGYDIDAFREAAKSRGASEYVLKEHLWKVRDLIASSITAGRPQ